MLYISGTDRVDVLTWDDGRTAVLLLVFFRDACVTRLTDFKGLEFLQHEKKMVYNV